EDTGEARQFWRQDTLVAAATGREPERPVLVRQRVEDAGAFLAEPPERLPGVVLGLRGPGAAPRFMPEAGLHLLRGPRPAGCLVETSEAGPRDSLPPSGITRRGAIGSQPRRRSYDRGLEVLDDVRLAAKLPWQGRPLDEALADAITRQLRRA